MKFVSKLKKFCTRPTETPDPVPLAASVPFPKQLTIQEQIARYMKGAQRLAALQGAESFEEADDFDCGSVS